MHTSFTDTPLPHWSLSVSLSLCLSLSLSLTLSSFKKKLKPDRRNSTKKLKRKQNKTKQENTKAESDVYREGSPTLRLQKLSHRWAWLVIYQPKSFFLEHGWNWMLDPSILVPNLQGIQESMAVEFGEILGSYSCQSGFPAEPLSP